MTLQIKEKNSVAYCYLSGNLDFESCQQFMEYFDVVKTQHQISGVIVNFKEFKFVGSSSMSGFVQFFKEAAVERPAWVKLCYMSPELEKLFRAFEDKQNPFHIVETEHQAELEILSPDTSHIPSDTLTVEPK